MKFLIVKSVIFHVLLVVKLPKYNLELNKNDFLFFIGKGDFYCYHQFVYYIYRKYY